MKGLKPATADEAFKAKKKVALKKIERDFADEKIRIERIIERDGIDEESARLRINAGKNDEYYKQRTQNIIYNNGEQNDFKDRFKAIINKILKENYDG